jgi:hypothetical protein
MKSTKIGTKGSGGGGSGGGGGSYLEQMVDVTTKRTLVQSVSGVFPKTSVVKLPALVERKEKRLREVDYGFLKPQTRKYARKLWATLMQSQPRPKLNMFAEIAVLDVACYACADIPFRKFMRRSLSTLTYTRLADVCFDIAYKLQIEPTYLKAVAHDIR